MRPRSCAHGVGGELLRLGVPFATEWWDQMQDGVTRFEYQPTISGGALQAPNRAHNLRTFFERSGIRVHDRTSGSDEPLIAMSLVALGRGPEPCAVTAGVVHQVGRRVEIRRAAVTEWYRNSAAGLEQGFTVWSKADGHGPLVLELAIERATARMRGTAIELLTDAGRRLDYGKLLAEDTRGRVLTSRLEVPAPDRLRLVIDDAEATYPLLIDPLLTAVACLVQAAHKGPPYKMGCCRATLYGLPSL